MFQKFSRSHLIMSTAVKNSPGAGLNTRAASPNKLFSCSHMNTCHGPAGVSSKSQLGESGDAKVIRDGRVG